MAYNSFICKMGRECEKTNMVILNVNKEKCVCRFTLLLTTLAAAVLGNIRCDQKLPLLSTGWISIILWIKLVLTVALSICIQFPFTIDF